MEKKNNDYIPQGKVIEMGFTKSMIEKLLPKPVVKPNPWYHNASPMKLWLKEDVLRIMQTDEYKQLLNEAQKRKQAAAKGVKKKEEALLSDMQRTIDEIYVKKISDEKLVELAIDARNSWNDYQQMIRSHYDCDYIRPEDVDKQTLARWVVNYIRHNLVESNSHSSDYDETLYDVRGKVGTRKAYVLFKKAVLHKIAEVYPKYKAECHRQINLLEGVEGNG